MPSRPVTIIEPATARLPLVVDSPHSGRIYPEDFVFASPLHLLRQTEDSYVDALIAGAVDAGATLIMAEFPRSYIDVNRSLDDIDPAILADTWDGPLNPSDRTLLGLGLVRRLCKSGVPVYDAPLPSSAIKKRIDEYYRPYHDALQKTISKRIDDFGECYLLNCHSMPNRGSENRAAARPDFVLGDRLGSSCDPAFTRRVQDILQEMGYTVALNDPYRGVEIVQRYGQPQHGQHALQMEINRRLYIDEQTLEKHEGFAKLQNDLTAFFHILAEGIAGDIPDRMAAE